MCCCSRLCPCPVCLLSPAYSGVCPNTLIRSRAPSPDGSQPRDSRYALPLARAVCGAICSVGPRPTRKLAPLSLSSSGLGSPVGVVPPPAPTPTPAGFFFNDSTGLARKGLPADPDMRELFTTVFLDFEKEIQTFHFLETVRCAVVPWAVSLPSAQAVALVFAGPVNNTTTILVAGMVIM